MADRQLAVVHELLSESTGATQTGQNRKRRSRSISTLKMDTVQIPPTGHNSNGRTTSLLEFERHDAANAERFVAVYGDRLRYCHPMKSWLCFDDRRWAVDRSEMVVRHAKAVLVEYIRQASDEDDEDHSKWARKSMDAPRISAMLKLAQPDLAITPDKLDANPDALNFLNGTLNLRTGELRPHRAGDFITKLVHHRYDRAAKCPRFRAFLSRIMGAHPDASEGELDRADRLCDYLQVAIGYSVTGHTTEKTVFVPHGGGNNGKTTLQATVAGCIPEYSSYLQVDTLMTRQENNNSQSDLADLRGARFVQTSETEDGQRLAQGKLKRITQGMGKIKAVRKYENPIEFPETHKLWMDTNRKPIIRDADDNATFNRLHPIPFTVSIPEHEIDRELPSKLMLEGEGILAWICEGARRWYVEGLKRPPEVERARETWREESDQTGRFITDCCLENQSAETKASLLYSEYRKWCADNGEREVTMTAFGRRLEARGFSKTRNMNGIHYRGLCVGVRV